MTVSGFSPFLVASSLCPVLNFHSKWGFPEVRGTVLGGSVSRTIVVWIVLGSPSLGKLLSLLQEVMRLSPGFGRVGLVNIAIPYTGLFSQSVYYLSFN